MVKSEGYPWGIPGYASYCSGEDFQAKPEGGGGHSVNKCKGKTLLM